RSAYACCSLWLDEPHCVQEAESPTAPLRGPSTATTNSATVISTTNATPAAGSLCRAIRARMLHGTVSAPRFPCDGVGRSEASMSETERTPTQPSRLARPRRGVVLDGAADLVRAGDQAAPLREVQAVQRSQVRGEARRRP